MRKLALFSLAVLALTAFARPPVLELTEGPLPKCGSDGHICMGSASSTAGAVEIGGPLLVDRPILVGPNSGTTTVVIDAGVTIVGSTVVTGTQTSTLVKTDTVDAGNMNVVGVAKVGTLKADVIDAGALQVGGGSAGAMYHLIPFTTAAIDFATGTIVCADSAGTTVTGAKTADACIVGMPSTLTAGGTGLHHSFTCYVSAADTIKIRQCAAGTADDPGSVTFTGWVISAVP